MCTALSINESNKLFGRTLDVECSYGEKIVIVPRKFPLKFVHSGETLAHFAIIGTALVKDGTPLFYDGMNEYGLAAAGLNFFGNAKYHEAKPGMRGIASFELIPLLLSLCKSVAEATELLRCVTITNDIFSEELPPSPLHWMVADRDESIVIESVDEGVKIYKNPYGVLTNNPPFPYHISNISNYIGLSPAAPENRLCPSLKIKPYSRGMGALGLPGDFSSASRFIRALYAKSHIATASEESDISRFFQITDCIKLPRGTALDEAGNPLFTAYTCCMELDTGSYFFTSYSSRVIRAVRLKECYMQGASLKCFDLYQPEEITELS